MEVSLNLREICTSEGWKRSLLPISHGETETKTTGENILHLGVSSPALGWGVGVPSVRTVMSGKSLPGHRGPVPLQDRLGER